jgi:hypothetical protein
MKQMSVVLAPDHVYVWGKGRYMEVNRVEGDRRAAKEWAASSLGGVKRVAGATRNKRGEPLGWDKGGKAKDSSSL